MSLGSWFLNKVDKANPGQSGIAESQPSDPPLNPTVDTYTIYKNMEVVNRGVNYIVDSCAEFDFDIKDRVHQTEVSIRSKKLHKLLTFQPNIYYNIDVFRRNIYMDLLVHGNAYIYWDGSFLYNIPAGEMKLIPSKKTYIAGYEYMDTEYKPEEIIHIRDNNAGSVFVGVSRIESCKSTLKYLTNMSEFIDGFFKNGTVQGIVLTSEDTLGDRFKKKKIAEWMQNFNPRSGGKRPAILDGGLKIEHTGTTDLRELDFQQSVKVLEDRVSKALGIPPVLLESGNNANISPNVRLYYTATVIPLVNKVVKAFEQFFGYDIELISSSILALRPDLKEEADYFSSLVNSGILTRNEAREKLRYEESSDEIAGKLILPANIAGSAVDHTSGGKPEQDDQK